MKRRTLVSLIAAGLLSLPLAAQPPEGYVDVDVVHVKMGKRMDFDAVNKRMVEMNRKNGDRWQAYEIVYGDSNAVYFVSTRSTFADAAQGMRNFENAVTNAVGAMGMHKLFNDFDAAAESEHEMIFRRRWDLSSNPPADLAASNRIAGQARWIRAVTVHTRPGKILAYEAELKLNKEANEQMNPGIPFWVSQSVAGTAPGTFRTVNLLKSLDEMDKIKRTQQTRGDSYASYQKTVEESVERVDIVIGRFLPELSNPPDDIVNVDTSFWRPKAAPVVASAKAKEK